MKYILILMIAFLTGCGTGGNQVSFNDERQWLTDAYSNGEINDKQYRAQMNMIDYRQGEAMRMSRAYQQGFQQFADGFKSKR